MTPESHGTRASTKQLAYLKALAQRTATTFTYPASRVQASREIERLRSLPAAARDQHAQPADTYGTAPHEQEIVGYGSSATWRSRGGSR